MKKKFLLCLLIATLLSGNSFAQRKGLSHKGNNSFKMEIIDIPENISSSFGTLKKQVLLCHPQIKNLQKQPLIISLHGSGGGAKPIESRMRASIIKEMSKPENHKYGSKILVPQSGKVWEPQSLSKMLNYIISKNKDIDVNRIYCVGYSMGGKGTWEWAMLEPKRFAAISPKGFIPNYSKVQEMAHLPIWAMVGTKDTADRVQGISKMKDYFTKYNSNNVKLTVFQGANHKTASAEAKKVENQYQWLFSHKNKFVD